MPGRIVLLVISLCLCACGRIGIEVVSAPAVTDADVPETDDDAGSDEPEPDADAMPDGEELDASEPLDAGVADAGSTDAGSLVLRYDFNGTGSTVRDRVGSSHAQVLGGAQLDGSGALTLDGSNDYVNMPNGLISRFSSVTVMVWFTFAGSSCWQRAFDFGSSSTGEGSAGNATSALALTPSSCPNNVVTGLFEQSGALRSASGTHINAGAPTQAALSFDGARGVMTLFVNGAMVADSAVPWQLAQIQDVNVWLGRSQWAQDAFFEGSLDELRIYARALGAPEVAMLNARGPDMP